MRREKCVHCKYDRHIYRQKDIDTLISKEQLMVFIKDFLDSILDDPNTKCCPTTVKPIALMEYLVKLVSREGAIVLDPFMGSGSTGIACKKLNRNFIGIEREDEYVKIANARINAKV